MDKSFTPTYAVTSGTILLVLLFILGAWKYMLKKSIKHLACLEGKHVVITGGSSGIGLALAKECLSQGASVTLIARNASRLSQAAHTLAASTNSQLGSSSSSLVNHRILLKAVDVSDDAAVSTAIVESFEWKPIDILICNAGVAAQALFINAKTSDMDKLTRINLLGCVYPVHAVLPLMKARSKQNPSSIVLMGSLSGLFFVSGGNMYTPTKHGLKGLAELLRFELMPLNIKVSLVCPGFTETPMLDDVDKAKVSTSKVLSKLQLYDRARAESAEEVAAKTMEGVKQGQFLITTSAVGFILRVLARGFVPADSLGDALTELLLLVPVRLFSFLWFAYAKRTMRTVNYTSQDKTKAN